MKKEKRKMSKSGIVILILLLLLLISIGALAIRLIYLHSQSEGGSSVVVPDNLIGTKPSDDPSVPIPPSSSGTSVPPSSAATEPSAGETTPSTGPQETEPPAETEPPVATEPPKEQYAASLALHKGQLTDNRKFTVKNMFPGDVETQYFCLKASHAGEITVYFTALVKDQTKNLADVLHIRVTQLDADRVLYDGPIGQMDLAGYGQSFQASAEEETLIYYKVEVSLPTSTGNEHQGAMLTADFQWFVTDDNNMMPPDTGDDSHIQLWTGLLIGSSVMLLILLLSRRRKEDADEQCV